MWPRESHGIPFSLYLQVFIAVSHWSGSMPLASAIPSYWALTGTPLGYPAVSLCRGDPAALDLQDRPLHTLQQLIDGVNVGMGQLIALLPGMGGSWIDQLSLILTTRVSSPALSQLVHRCSRQQGEGPVLHSQVL